MKNSDYRAIFLEENLCPLNRKLFSALYKLKKTRKIHSVWSYNGKVFYKEDEADGKGILCKHLDDIKYLFENDDNDSYDETFRGFEERF